jgi:O-antigen/teichoic acid export membrane protein
VNAPAQASVAARGTVLLVGSRCFFMVAGYIISLVLARGLGPADYGVYGVVISCLLWLEMAGTAGLPGAMARLIPQHPDRPELVEQSARAILLAWSVLLFAASWIAAPWIARLFNMPDATWLFRVAFIDIPVNGLYVAYHGRCNGLRHFGVLSAGYVVYSVTKVVATLVLLALGLSIEGALIVNIVATLGGIGFFMIKAPPRGWRVDPQIVRLILQITLGIGLYLALIQVLLTLDLWMLQALWKGSQDVIGYYVAALNVAKLPLVIPSALTGVIFSSIAWARENGDNALAQRHLQAATRFGLVVLVPSCGLAILHAEPIMALLYSDVYAAGGKYLAVQIIGLCLLTFLDAYLHSLMAVDRRRTAVLLLLSLVPISLTLNAVLIPRWGGVGAAAALSGTLFLGTLLATVVATREFGALIRPLTVGRVVLATAAMLALGAQFHIQGPWLLLKLGLLLGVYVVLLGVLGELTRRDLHPFAVWQKRPA